MAGEMTRDEKLKSMTVDDVLEGMKSICDAIQLVVFRADLKRLVAQREAQARRTSLEEACRAMCHFCRTGVKVENNDGWHWHKHSTKGSSISCAANEIRKLLAEAQEQAQEDHHAST